MKRICVVLGFAFAVSLASCRIYAQGSVYYNAFSHNDYSRGHPLWDALSYRFNCVEADLWLIDGELYVSHDRPEISDGIIFGNLYLKPLMALVDANGGKVYAESDRPFYLMIDCKTEGEEMLPVLEEQLAPYADKLCFVADGVYTEGAVFVFLSGKAPRESLAKEKSRFLFLDGTISDLGKRLPANLYPVISDNYSAFFSWKGEGEMPGDELQKMRGIIGQAHAEGKLFRWWGAPDTEQFKRFFIKEGVDLIGADSLKVLYDILREK